MERAPGLTVIGNLAVDRVNGAAPSPGGCPSFAALVFSSLRASGAVCGRILTRCAPGDAGLFGAITGPSGAPTTILEARRTCAFALDYDGEDRTLSVAALGEAWTPAQLRAAGIATTWVHAAPLLRDEFPTETLLALRDAGHRLSFDGQGLVRVARLGTLALDDAFDPAILGTLDVLKLAAAEAAVIAGGAFTAAHARGLGVAEILVTRGSDGVELYLDGHCEHAFSGRRIADVHSTGAGDMFAVAYGAARAQGSPPPAAAQAACELVAD
ncbi:MAG: PfkB family carbohydrate kinase, partial [Solirubrobacteraceae bacterium]